MKQYQLRNGQILTIRNAKNEDASVILGYVNIVGVETDNLTFGEGGLEYPKRKRLSSLKVFRNRIISLCSARF